MKQSTMEEILFGGQRQRRRRGINHRSLPAVADVLEVRLNLSAVAGMSFGDLGADAWPSEFDFVNDLAFHDEPYQLDFIDSADSAAADWSFDPSYADFGMEGSFGAVEWYDTADAQPIYNATDVQEFIGDDGHYLVYDGPSGLVMIDLNSGDGSGGQFQQVSAEEFYINISHPVSHGFADEQFAFDNGWFDESFQADNTWIEGNWMSGDIGAEDSFIDDSWNQIGWHDGMWHDDTWFGDEWTDTSFVDDTWNDTWNDTWTGDTFVGDTWIDGGWTNDVSMPQPSLESFGFLTDSFPAELETTDEFADSFWQNFSNEFPVAFEDHAFEGPESGGTDFLSSDHESFADATNPIVDLTNPDSSWNVQTLSDSVVQQSEAPQTATPPATGNSTASSVASFVASTPSGNEVTNPPADQVVHASEAHPHLDPAAAMAESLPPRIAGDSEYFALIEQQFGTESPAPVAPVANDVVTTEAQKPSSSETAAVAQDRTNHDAAIAKIAAGLTVPQSNIVVDLPLASVSYSSVAFADTLKFGVSSESVLLVQATQQAAATADLADDITTRQASFAGSQFTIFVLAVAGTIAVRSRWMANTPQYRGLACRQCSFLPPVNPLN